jgi:hypothetical protein
MPEVVNHAPWKWMQANGLPSTIPDDAHIDVDEQAGTITVEVWALTAEGGLQLHAGRALTTVATFPLVVPPPPGLMDAYRHTVARIRAERNAVAGIRQQAAAIIEEYLIARGHPGVAGARPDPAAAVPAAGRRRHHRQGADTVTSFVCKPCGDKQHGACPGGTRCDCQHVTQPKEPGR